MFSVKSRSCITINYLPKFLCHGLLKLRLFLYKENTALVNSTKVRPSEIKGITAVFCMNINKKLVLI